MEKLVALIEKLKAIDQNIILTIEKVIQENEALILDMNTQDQLFDKGINREGVSINSFAPYAPLTIQIKSMKGQPTSRVTLRDEGDFHHSFYIEYHDGGFEIRASDWKTEMLMANYGDTIIGLSDQNFKELAENYVYPALTNLFTKIVLKSTQKTRENSVLMILKLFLLKSIDCGSSISKKE